MTATNSTCRILLMAALPQEYGPFKGATGPWRRSESGSYPCFEATWDGKELVLVESGMGPQKASGALQWVWNARGPFDLIISFGFAGALDPRLRVGDVALGSISLFWPIAEEGRVSGKESALPKATFSPELKRFCRKEGVLEARIVTVERPQPKATLARRLAETLSHIPALTNGSDVFSPLSPFLVDMESAAVASFCRKRRTPFLLLRAVSDTLEDEIPFDVETLTGADGRITPLRALKAIAGHPHLLSSFFLTWQNSRKASRRLASVLVPLLGLPAEALLPMAPACHSSAIS